MTVQPAVIADWIARLDARVQSAAALLEGQYRGVQINAGESGGLIEWPFHDTSLEASLSSGDTITLNIEADCETTSLRLCADVRWGSEPEDAPALVSTFEGFAEPTAENFQRVEDDLPRLIDTLTAAIEQRAPKFLTGGRDVFEIDGRDFDTVEGFHAAFGRVVGTEGWGTSYDAFNDVLRGGFGSPRGGFVLRWKSSDVSRVALGYPATIKEREQWLARGSFGFPRYDSAWRAHIAQIAAMRRGEGSTIFDTLVEILRDHGPGGSEAEDGVVLELA